MTQSDFLGLRLLKSLLASKDTSKLEQVRLEDFLPGKCREAFAWVLSYYLQYNSMPIDTALEDEFGKILPADVEDFQYIHAQVLKRNLTFKLTKNLERVAGLLDDNEPERALKELTDVIETGVVVPEVKIASYIKDAKQRIDEYKVAATNKVFDGILCPWPELGTVITGFMNGCLTVFLAASGVGKAQPLSSLVLTPAGYLPIGKVQAGDQIINWEGGASNITGIFPQGIIPVYEVVFSDKTSTRCSGDHLWQVGSLSKGVTTWEVLTTKELQGLIDKASTFKATKYEIPITSPIEFQKQAYPIDPYFLGCLLGDGCLVSHDLRLTNTSSELIQHCQNTLISGYVLKWIKSQPLKFDYSVVKKGMHKGKGRGVNYYKDWLSNFGLLGKGSCVKFIPRQYLFGSIEDRLEILRGLMDTDGSVGPSFAEYGSCSIKLIQGVTFLVQSLGGIAVCASRMLGGKLHYRLRIMFKVFQQIFKLSRKAKKWEANYFRVKTQVPHVRKYITNIKYVGMEECACISTSHPSRLYLTNDCIVTHNTWLSCIVANECLNDNKKVLFVTMEMATPRIFRRMDALRNKVSFGKMRNSALTDDDIKAWEASVGNEASTGDIIVVDKRQVRTPQDVYLLARKHNPRIVIVDGSYRFESTTKGRAQWEDAAKIATDLQLYAESTNIPWLVTSQLNVIGDKSGKIQMSDARYSKEFGICADVVCALSQAPEDRLLKKMRIHLLKVRDHDSESSTEEVYVNWDLVSFNFSQHSPINFGTVGVVIP